MSTVYMIPKDDKALYIRLEYIPFEYLKLPIFAVKDSVEYDTGEMLEGWFMTDKKIEINPENPPYLVNGAPNMQLIINGIQNTKLLSLIWALAQAMDKYTVDKAGDIHITIVDEGKLINQIGAGGYKNKWIVWNGEKPDDLEVIKHLMNRRKYKE